jgi:flagellar motor switch/type III secretory pathway protein FliN
LLIENAVATPEALGCTLCLGGRPFGRAELRSGKLHVIEWNAQGESAMSSRTPDGDSHQEIAFAEIQVDLRFELAQWRTTLADVSGLAPGTILEVGHRIDDQSVSVFVEHRCVGKGQLVAIGERLGVRLSSVFGANAATADAATRAVDSGEAVV